MGGLPHQSMNAPTLTSLLISKRPTRCSTSVPVSSVTTRNIALVRSRRTRLAIVCKFRVVPPVTPKSRYSCALCALHCQVHAAPIESCASSCKSYPGLLILLQVKPRPIQPHPLRLLAHY